MKKQLIINVEKDEMSLAILEEGKLQELYKENMNTPSLLGNIYLGRVKKVMNNLNSAFIDIGVDRFGFMHQTEITPNFSFYQQYIKDVVSGKQTTAKLENYNLTPDKESDKTQSISEILKNNMEIMVQVQKEPISNKGARLTTDISLPGRYVVLIPFSNQVAISQKIGNKEERERLLNIVENIKPKNFGVIIRTASEKKTVVELQEDIESLYKRWEICFQNLKTARPPQQLLGEVDRTEAIIRDVFNDSFTDIIVNSEKYQQSIKQYISKITNKDILKLYKGEEHIFEHFGINKQIKSNFGKYVNMKNGAYLIIEHTEALHVIDVNSGYKANSKLNQESNALEINLMAAVEVAKQLKLRDMGGIIVVDFIDMRSLEHRKRLYKTLKEAMADDKAKHKILPPSRFGIVQITRQRVRPVMNIDTTEACPTCQGTGKVESSILITDKIENHLAFIAETQNIKEITIQVHPYIYAYLTKGIFSKRLKWQWKYKKRIKLQEDSRLPLLSFYFLDKNGDYIKLN